MSATEKGRVQDFLVYIADRSFCIGQKTIAASQGDLFPGDVLTNAASAVKVTSAATAANAESIIIQTAEDSSSTQVVYALTRGPATVIASGLSVPDANLAAATASLLAKSNIKVIDEVDARTL